MRYIRLVVVLTVAVALSAAFMVRGQLLPPAADQVSISDDGASERDGAPNQMAPVGESASTPAPRAELRLAERAIKQYGRLKLSASGFLPGEDVIITAMPGGDAQPIELGQLPADDQGRIGEFAVDLPEGVTSGPRPVTVAGTSSHRQATEALYVRSEKLFAVLSSYTPRPMDRLGFVAGGFEPGEDVRVFLRNTQGEPLATVPTDEAGNTDWTEALTPVVEPGEYDLIFQGSQSNNRHVQRLTISPLAPTLELSPWAGPPGSKLDLNGRGFLPGEEVQAFIGRGDRPATTFKADQYGNFWGVGPLVVPASAGGGRLEVRLAGQLSGAEVTQTFAVVGVKPWAELSAYSGMPGTAVSFGGGGFAAKERVSVHLGNGNGPVVATGTTDEQGTVVRSTTTTVPADAASRTQTKVTFVLVGEESQGEASAVFTVIAPVVPSWAGERPRSP